jgi:thioredoxin reductase (NADPH)
MSLIPKNIMRFCKKELKISNKMETKNIKCLIIGSGPAGYTAAIYAARANLKPILYTGLVPGGQLTETTEVDNFPGYPKGTTGTQLMDDLKEQAERFGTEIKYGIVTKVDFQKSPKQIWIDDETLVTATAVIVSTGASAKWLGLPNETRLRMSGGGVSACAVCDGFFFKNKYVAVVGAGDTAAEEATYLAKICRKVYLIVRKNEMKASKIMQEKILSTPNIEVLYNSETQDIIGEQRVEAVVIKNNVTETSTIIPVSGFFIAIGHKPNTDIFTGQLNMDELGYISTEPHSTKTNIEGVYAVGDCADKIYRQAITAAGSGCMGALDAERFLETIEMTGTQSLMKQ